MTSPSHSEVLHTIYEVLTEDQTLKSMVSNRIYNHVPQDTQLPFIRFRWEQAGEWDTKDSAGFDGFIVIDIWSDHRGDKQALDIADRIDSLLHLSPLELSIGQSLILRHDFRDSFVEPDGLTHHTVSRFQHIVTT